MDRYQHYRKLLEAKALELTIRIDGLDEPLPPHDAGDVASGCVAKEMMAAFQDTRTRLLVWIHHAIGRIQKGTYGTCLNCEARIPEKRLEAVPWTPYCVACQEAFDGGELVTEPVRDSTEAA